MDDLFNLVFVADDPFSTIVKIFILLICLDVVSVISNGLGRFR